MVTDTDKEDTEVRVRLNSTQKQKLNLKVKDQKTKQEELFSLAMREAVLSYDESVKLRKANKAAKRLRKIVEEVNVKFRRRLKKKNSRGSVQRYYETYVNTNKADNQLISEVFKKKVPGPKVKVPPVLLKALSVSPL